MLLKGQSVGCSTNRQSDWERTLGPFAKRNRKCQDRTL